MGINIKKIIVALLLSLPTLVFAAGGSNVPLDHADYDLKDKASLQNGMKIYMNYCLGCHAQQYQRHNTSFEDLGIPEELGEQHLQFTGEKVSDYIKSAMPTESAAKWFGAPPPDLTLVARVRGADWLYTYLRTFYKDESRPFGVNNKVFPDVGMPHVLQELQGMPSQTTEKRMVDGEMVDRYIGIKSDGTGELSESEYDQAVLDLVNYLVYTGEPARLEREAMGKWVLVFILVLFVFAFLLKKDYWREVH